MVATSDELLGPTREKPSCSRISRRTERQKTKKFADVSTDNKKYRIEIPDGKRTRKPVC